MSTANWLISAGVLLILIGVLYKFGLMNWFGNLPGDLKYEGEKTKVYFPWVSMLLISIALSLLLSLLRK